MKIWDPGCPSLLNGISSRDPGTPAPLIGTCATRQNLAQGATQAPRSGIFEEQPHTRHGSSFQGGPPRYLVCCLNWLRSYRTR